MGALQLAFETTTDLFLENSQLEAPYLETIEISSSGNRPSVCIEKVRAGTSKYQNLKPVGTYGFAEGAESLTWAADRCRGTGLH